MTKTSNKKYNATLDKEGNPESILGSRNNPKGGHKTRTRKWRIKRSKLLTGQLKRLRTVLVKFD